MCRSSSAVCKTAWVAAENSIDLVFFPGSWGVALCHLDLAPVKGKLARASAGGLKTTRDRRYARWPAGRRSGRGMADDPIKQGDGDSLNRATSDMCLGLRPQPIPLPTSKKRISGPRTLLHSGCAESDSSHRGFVYGKRRLG